MRNKQKRQAKNKQILNDTIAVIEECYFPNENRLNLCTFRNKKIMRSKCGLMFLPTGVGRTWKN